MTFEKNVDANHVVFAKKFEDEVNNSIKANVVKQLIIKKPNISITSI